MIWKETARLSSWILFFPFMFHIILFDPYWLWSQQSKDDHPYCVNKAEAQGTTCLSLGSQSWYTAPVRLEPRHSKCIQILTGSRVQHFVQHWENQQPFWKIGDRHKILKIEGDLEEYLGPIPSFYRQGLIWLNDGPQTIHQIHVKVSFPPSPTFFSTHHDDISFHSIWFKQKLKNLVQVRIYLL